MAEWECSGLPVRLGRCPRPAGSCACEQGQEAACLPQEDALQNSTPLAAEEAEPEAFIAATALVGPEPRRPAHS